MLGIVDAIDLMERFAIMTVDGNWQDGEAVEELKRLCPELIANGEFDKFLDTAGLSQKAQDKKLWAKLFARRRGNDRNK